MRKRHTVSDKRIHLTAIRLHCMAAGYSIFGRV